MKNKKIMMLIQSAKGNGGIANYYNSLNGKFNLEVEYFERGARKLPYRDGKIKEFFRAISDLLRFILRMASNKYEIVVISPSLKIGPVFRDALFIIFAKLFNVKVIVFFRGWYISDERKIEKKYLNLFKSTYFKSDAIIVLASTFKAKLIEWGYNKPIYLETTIVNQTLLDSFNEDFVKNKYEENKEHIKILFLSSYLGKLKGVYDIIDAYAELKKKHNVSLTIVGGDSADPLEFGRIQKYAEDKNASEIVFTGYIKGERKIEVFKTHDIYVFPSHSEGMPNSLLEALACGMPSIITPVGGVPDIFKHGENGFLVEIQDIDKIVEYTELLINNPELRLKIAITNFRFARTMFTPSQIVKRLEIILTETINK